MLTILIVDDSEQKINKIITVIQELDLITNVITANTNACAMKELLNQEVIDLLILDLNLPIRKGEKAKKDAGLLLLTEIKRRNTIKSPNHIIGLTAYEDIKTEYQSHFNIEGWVLATFNLKYTDWEQTIKNKIDHIAIQNHSENMRKSKILFIAASPTDQGELNSGLEQRKIDEALTSSSLRDKFEIISKPGAKLNTLSGELLKKKPEFVHFTGHGDTSCIALEQDNGETHKIPSEALAKLFMTLKENLKCVVLSACYSADQAKAISTNGIYVIGMNNSVGVDDATAFANGFYQAVGEGKNIPTAFNLGEVHYLASCDKLDRDIPELWYKGIKL